MVISDVMAQSFRQVGIWQLLLKSRAQFQKAPQRSAPLKKISNWFQRASSQTTIHISEDLRSVCREALLSPRRAKKAPPRRVVEREDPPANLVGADCDLFSLSYRGGIGYLRSSIKLFAFANESRN
jgi:hypothetical protein